MGRMVGAPRFELGTPTLQWVLAGRNSTEFEMVVDLPSAKSLGLVFPRQPKPAEPRPRPSKEPAAW